MQMHRVFDFLLNYAIYARAVAATDITMATARTNAMILVSLFLIFIVLYSLLSSSFILSHIPVSLN